MKKEKGKKKKLRAKWKSRDILTKRKIMKQRRKTR